MIIGLQSTVSGNRFIRDSSDVGCSMVVYNAMGVWAWLIQCGVAINLYFSLMMMILQHRDLPLTHPG